MSSTYGLICLNHDPATEFGDRETCYEPEPILAAAKDPAGHGHPEHAQCDLVVAGYSYPIVRIACPGKSDRGGACRWHVDPHWIEADSLRLLIAAYQAVGAVPERVTEPFASRCWKRERALRLGLLLGIPDGAPAPAPPLGQHVTSGPVAINVLIDAAGQPQGVVAACRCGDKWIWDSTAHGVAVARFLNAHAVCGTLGAATVRDSA